MRYGTRRFRVLLGAAALLCAPLSAVWAQASAKTKPSVTIYGFALADAIYDGTGLDPAWFDAARPTRLPAFQDEFGKPGQFYFGVRQTRFGVKAETATKRGDARAVFDFDLFGTGSDAGQTTIRVRHAYAELGHFLMGQAESPFMDLDVFPNSWDYWGPNGMVFFRNVLFRWTPIMGDRQLQLALERPGASADQGTYAGRVELSDVAARFPVPDLSASYKFGGNKWGYVRLAGILRYIKWDDLGNQPFDLSGDAVAWGVNVSSNIHVGPKGTLRLQAIYGPGVENYMNDAPVDIGIENNPSDPLKPVVGKAIPVLGLVAFYDHTWNEQWTSTIGGSMVDISNTDAQAPDAYHQGQYVLVNLLFYPVPGMIFGPEVQYIRRANFSDGWTTDGIRLQISGKYSFTTSIGGK